MAIYLSKSVRLKSQSGYGFVRLLRFAPAMLRICMLSLTACSNIKKSSLAGERAEVHVSSVERGFETGKITDKNIDNIVHHYRRYGYGPVFVTVTYKPGKKGDQTFEASQSGADLAKRLRRHRVRQVKMDVMPHDTKGDTESLTVISYKKLSATGPSGCNTSQAYRTGNPSSDREVTKKYKLGCNIETMLARQVERPGDLLGYSHFDQTKPSGRRAANIINRYEEGEPNEPLDGFTASDVGSQ